MASDRDEPRRIDFAGRRWWVKRATEPVGPGGNRFDDSTDAVDVDTDGTLVLRVRRVGTHWWCAEIVGEDATGFGTYEWTVRSDVRRLPSDVVCGMFTWSEDPAHDNRELDVEVSAWGQPTGVVGTFVVQPAIPEHVQRFSVPSAVPWRCSFDWRRDGVTFRATGALPWTAPGGSAPPAGAVHPRLNLWLFAGAQPSDPTPTEVRFADFRFTPAPTAQVLRRQAD